MPTKCQRDNEDNSERGVMKETNFSKYKKTNNTTKNN